MTRRQLLQLAAASGAVALVPSSLEALAGPHKEKLSPAKTVRFLAFGDWGSGMRLQREVAAGMARFASEQRAKGTPLDFAVSVGDNFYDDGVRDHLDPQWKLKFEEMYPREAMPFPFFAVLGNHDWKTNPQTQFSYRGPSGRWRMDGFYYKVSAGAGLLDLFMVDTDLWLPQYRSKALGDKQTAWLDESLGKSSAKWKLIVGHHPPHTDGVYAISSDIHRVRDIVAPLCQKHGVHLMMSGHDHDLQHIVLPDSRTQFIVTGAGGASLRPRLFARYEPFYQGFTGGFTTFEITPHELRGRFFDSHLKPLHEWTQRAARV